ncbi:MAG: TIGR04348 family glycosyltransferase [Herminiimonas sp.]|nr:TIGR04348 family glycosyltransferase [Herminiimonas sp.]
MQLNKSYIAIIGPALAKANNGNWQTARRWQQFLGADYRVTCMTDWQVQADGGASPALMVALHARRSAPAVAAFAMAFPQRPLVLVLTGTDLYRDIAVDTAAQRSLALATRIVVLQPAGVDVLPPAVREKTQVIYQSAATLAPHVASPRARRFTVIMIGHLRAEKDPQSYMQAAALVTAPQVRMVHLGAALEPALGQLAQRTQATVSRYVWRGGLPQPQTRQCLKRSALMVISSRMEGGANVIIEAVTSGVPVLASDIDGNRGMLGPDYAGYFAVGDSAALARMIDRAATDLAFYTLLRHQCARRAPLFAPVRERAAVLELVDNCLPNPLQQTGTQ